jgi:hypothetical protein
MLLQTRIYFARTSRITFPRNRIHRTVDTTRNAPLTGTI